MCDVRTMYVVCSVCVRASIDRIDSVLHLLLKRKIALLPV